MTDNSSNYRLDKIGFGSIKMYQNPSDFCYGIDAVILADFASRSKAKRFLDLGCGNGIIPLILCHKVSDIVITGVEKRCDVAKLAAYNVEINGLNDRIDIIPKDIMALNLPRESYDAIVTNPPYVPKGSGVLNENNNERMTARHETSAKLKDFISIASGLLVNKGEFYMVHRPSRTVEIINSLSEAKLVPKIIRYVSPKRGDRPNIMLIKAIKNGGSEVDIREPLYVYSCDGSYTDEIMEIYERI